MEKIYMNSENRSQKSSKFKQTFNNKNSLVITLCVAAIAIVSLIAFGFNQISFAANDGTLPDTFVSAQGDSSTKVTGEVSGVPGGVLPILGFHAIIDDLGTKIPIFCIEYNVTYKVGETYTKGSEITDYGLMYLMSKLYPNVGFVDDAGEELPENVQVWVTQAAIWSYLYEKGDPNNSNFSEWNDKVKQVDKLYDPSYATTGQYLITTPGSTIFERFGINALIAEAKKITSPDVALQVKKNSDKISMTNDNKYYQTDLISVVGSTSSPIISSYEGYSVDLSRVPVGTILVDESGNVYDDVSNMSPTSKFYVRVPVDKVTEENKNLQIAVNGNFMMFGANRYTSGEYQEVANVKLRNQYLSKPLDVQLNYTPKVPDTGMGTAQTIYFIGLIILLSGVGIIYANAKPKESK